MSYITFEDMIPQRPTRGKTFIIISGISGYEKYLVTSKNRLMGINSSTYKHLTNFTGTISFNDHIDTDKDYIDEFFIMDIEKGNVRKISFKTRGRLNEEILHECCTERESDIC